jgi:hypothetical protein
MGYIDGACSVPEWIITLAFIGGALIYALVGALIFVIIKSFKEDLEWDSITFFMVFWPIIIVVSVVMAVIYYFARLIAMPIVGTDKSDLKDLERKVNTDIKDLERKVNTDIKEEDKKVMDYLKYEYKPSKRKESKAKAKPSKKKRNN